MAEKEDLAAANGTRRWRGEEGGFRAMSVLTLLGSRSHGVFQCTWVDPTKELSISNGRSEPSASSSSFSLRSPGTCGRVFDTLFDLLDHRRSHDPDHLIHARREREARGAHFDEGPFAPHSLGDASTPPTHSSTAGSLPMGVTIPLASPPFPHAFSDSNLAAQVVVNARGPLFADKESRGILPSVSHASSYIAELNATPSMPPPGHGSAPMTSIVSPAVPLVGRAVSAVMAAAGTNGQRPLGMLLPPMVTNAASYAPLSGSHSAFLAFEASSQVKRPRDDTLTKEELAPSALMALAKAPSSGSTLSSLGPGADQGRPITWAREQPNYGLDRTPRARRSPHDIVRVYACTFPGCDKRYGEISHLNTHIRIKKHGPVKTFRDFPHIRRPDDDTRRASPAASMSPSLSPPPQPPSTSRTQTSRDALSFAAKEADDNVVLVEEANEEGNNKRPREDDDATTPVRRRSSRASNS